MPDPGRQAVRTQYIEDGVLVRPLEGPATNFLGSRYYDGRGIVDHLESPHTAHTWMRTLAEEIRFPASPFIPADDQLERLRLLRDNIESAYRSTVNGDVAQAAARLQAVLDQVHVHPRVAGVDGRLRVSWGGATDNPYDQLVAGLAVSAAVTVTGHPATLLRKCDAPRCVLYFTRHNSRQHWCSEVCGNRARVARSTRSGREAAAQHL